MTRDRKPPRQPLFWAALAFSLGLWTGSRAWRPPSWWVIAVVAFVFAASWFLPKRPWLAQALSLGAWLLLGAFLIHGLVPGPDMLTKHLELTYSMVWSIAIANILGSGLCFAFSGQLAKIATLR